MFFRPFTVGDVLDVASDPGDPPILPNGFCRGSNPELSALVSCEGKFEVVGFSQLDTTLEGGGDFRLILGGVTCLAECDVLWRTLGHFSRVDIMDAIGLFRPGHGLFCHIPLPAAGFGQSLGGIQKILHFSVNLRCLRLKLSNSVSEKGQFGGIFSDALVHVRPFIVGQIDMADKPGRYFPGRGWLSTVMAPLWARRMPKNTESPIKIGISGGKTRPASECYHFYFAFDKEII